MMAYIKVTLKKEKVRPWRKDILGCRSRAWRREKRCARKWKGPRESHWGDARETFLGGRKGKGSSREEEYGCKDQKRLTRGGYLCIGRERKWTDDGVKGRSGK